MKTRTFQKTYRSFEQLEFRSLLSAQGVFGIEPSDSRVRATRDASPQAEFAEVRTKSFDAQGKDRVGNNRQQQSSNRQSDRQSQREQQVKVTLNALTSRIQNSRFSQQSRPNTETLQSPSLTESTQAPTMPAMEILRTATNTPTSFVTNNPSRSSIPSDLGTGNSRSTPELQTYPIYGAVRQTPHGQT